MLPYAELVLLLMAVAFVAGYVDAVGGGGGLLTVPALLYAGLSPVEALATNKLQGTFGVAASSFRFWKAGYIDLSASRLAVVGAAAGAAAGSLAVSRIDPALLRTIVPGILILAACYFAVAPWLPASPTKQPLTPLGVALAVAVPIGFYDGFLGPGTGSFFVLGLMLLAGRDLVRATAQTKLLNLASNVAALAVFLAGDKINFALGLPMILGQMAGGWLGAQSAVRHGATIIRPMVIFVSSARAIRLLLANHAM